MKIEELNLSVRAYHCLKRKHINTVEQLQTMSDKDLLRIRGFGAKCLDEIRQIVRQSPIIPGPTEDDHNIAELCFRNGEQNMKDKVIALLMEDKTSTNSLCHRHTVDLIQRIENL